MNQVEIWKDVVGYEGLYQVSSLGRAKRLACSKIGTRNRPSIRKDRILRPAKNRCGYLIIVLYIDGTGTTTTLHKLIAQSFLDRHYNKKGLVCNHIDGIKTNNNIKNLEVTTYSENHKHAYRIGLKSALGEKNSFAKLNETHVLEIREKYKTGLYTQKELGIIFGVARQTIGMIVTYNIWTHI